MMRGRRAMATACRLPDGAITVRAEPAPSIFVRYRWLNIPFVRGLPALVDTVRLGFRSLFFSADVQTQAEGTAPIRPWHFALSLLVALTVVIVVFILLPTGAAQWTLPAEASAFSRNLVEGTVRLALLLAYLVLISRMQTIQRVFQYHGAEHMVINAYEAGSDLAPAAVRPFPTLHPRCGTAFLVLFVLIGFLVHLAMGWPEGWQRYASRLVAIPIIAGLAYEWIRLAGRAPHSKVLRAASAPGLWAQYLTTRRPDDDQLEVAIASLQACIAADGAEDTGAAPAAGA